MTVRTRPRRLPAVVALSVAALLLTSGGAVAGTLITGAQIKDGTVTTKDVKDRSLRTADLSRATVQQLRTPGARGPAGAPGTPGTPGAPGLVRGYGRVAPNGTVSQASPGTSVARAAEGVYCVSVAGVDGATTVAVVSPDYALSSTGTGANNTQSFIEYVGESALCPATAIAVRTFVRSYVTSSGDLISTSLTLEDQPFTFLVP
ncbi:collagen-like triple helix repeat-containing protein [Nocardioides lianchengensis]|uniref:Collagen triple helix repeat-containing protein n=1 Tax=Nocardioides lianchengensis TaxID=1045774 RepID=A0A1G6LAA8_9ACTN|nr:collagen-like protein [Nocardioides lianchengensis]NYG12631.1 hypothetical protein [Nocardioides lianchengensis]SDC39977.1 hypothetical protein SAMN05421872_102170 [Nocardioides lianchengensis]